MQLVTHMKQQGDTLVEVLIAILVVSVVLVAGYTASTRNVNILQDTQEHSEALQLARTQLEFLHNSSTMPTLNQCFQLNGTPTSTACSVNSSGSPAGNTQTAFHISFCPPGSTGSTCPIGSPHPNAYAVTIEWTGLGANQADNNSVSLFYQP
jgi:prepilin-type N-terminal cleavage/methylation domain-containing protein